MSPAQIGAVANLVIAISYVVITGVIAVPLVRQRQLRANRLGAATMAIFFTCAVHHGAVGLVAAAASSGVQLASGAFLFVCSLHPGPGGVVTAGPVGFKLASALPTPPPWDWWSVAVDVFGAGVGLHYVRLRRTYGSLMRGPVLFEDLREQQRQALQINDNIVQGLTVAHLALEVGDVEKGAAALDETLASARVIISGLLLQDRASGARLGPGDLMRKEAAVVIPGRKRRRR